MVVGYGGGGAPMSLTSRVWGPFANPLQLLAPNLEGPGARAPSPPRVTARRSRRHVSTHVSLHAHAQSMFPTHVYAYAHRSLCVTSTAPAPARRHRRWSASAAPLTWT